MPVIKVTSILYLVEGGVRLEIKGLPQSVRTDNRKKFVIDHVMGKIAESAGSDYLMFQGLAWLEEGEKLRKDASIKLKIITLIPVTC